MSLMPTPVSPKWKWSLSIGVVIGLVSGLAGIGPFYINFYYHEALARLAYLFRLFELPGLFLQALILQEAHGGGSPLETVFLVIPLNILLYTLFFYGVITGFAKFSAKVRIIIGAILVIILVSVLVPAIRKFNHLRKVYGLLKPGASKTEVLQEWGPPSFSSICSGVRWDGTPIPIDAKSCVEELWYSSPITSESWGVGFDKDGHAISKDHNIFP